jgi:hypothetical protein
MSALYQDVFEYLGLPFYEDSVGDIPEDLKEKGYQQRRQKLLEVEPSNASNFALGLMDMAHSVLGFINPDMAFGGQKDDGSIYLGNFNLEDNSASIVPITNKRLQVLDELISRLEQQLRGEEDTVIREKIDLAIFKAKQKRHKAYSEFEEPFKQAFANDISLKIREYEHQDRFEERAYRAESSSLQHYQGRNAEDIEIERQKFRAREDFIHNYSRSPEGYLKYLKDVLSEDAYAFFLKQLRARIPLQERKKHSYLVAKTGSGKSELLKVVIYNEIKNLANASSSIILIDPHGDVAEEIAQFKEFATEEGRERLVYIDPTLKDGTTPSINPFELKIINDKTVAVMTQELKRILGVLLAGAGATMQMEAILSPCISTLLRKKDASFKDLQRFMDDSRNQDLVALGQKNPNPEHRNLFKYKFHDDGYKATKHGIYTRIQILLNDPIFQKLISDKTTIDLEQLTNEKKIILFKLSLGEVGSESVEAFGRFIVGMMRVIALKRSDTPKHLRVPIHLYIDEFQNFVSDDIEKVLTQLRKYGLFLTLAHQYIGQGNIDPQLQKALFSSGVKIIGQNERKTLKAAEQEINIPFEKLQKLKVGEFYIQTGSNPSFKVKAPTYLLGDNHAMKPIDWEAIKQYNLEHYYRKVTTLNADEELQLENDALHEEIQQAKDIKRVSANGKLKPKYDI